MSRTVCRQLGAETLRGLCRPSLCRARGPHRRAVRRRRVFAGRAAALDGSGLSRLPPCRGGAAGAARRAAVAARAVSRADPRLQGSGVAARRAAVRRGAGAARRACDDRRRDLGRYRLGRDSRPAATAPPIDIFILYPHGRISEVQRRQMTTVDAANAHAVAIEGTFDDCQDLVKALFADPALRARAQPRRRSTRSTGRGSPPRPSTISPPAAALGAPARPVSFSVPTGNFGNVYAGHVARAHGAAGRAAGHRHQPQRHPRPLFRRPAR